MTILIAVQEWLMPDPEPPVVEELCSCGHSRELHWHSFCDGTGRGEVAWCRTTCGCKEYRGPVEKCLCGCPKDNHQLLNDGDGRCEDCDDCMEYRQSPGPVEGFLTCQLDPSW